MSSLWFFLVLYFSSMSCTKAIHLKIFYHYPLLITGRGSKLVPRPYLLRTRGVLSTTQQLLAHTLLPMSLASANSMAYHLLYSLKESMITVMVQFVGVVVAFSLSPAVPLVPCMGLED
jgi:hypothetical protein